NTWGTFAEGLATAEDGKADGVGIVLGDGLIGIDLDHCRDAETTAIEEWALEIVCALDSYTEISPSGRGLHTFARCELPIGPLRKGKIEIYADGRYFTVTGQHLEGTPRSIEERTNQLAALH